jgi:5-methylcytosine-specific restriction enzyme subunit McrC
MPRPRPDSYGVFKPRVNFLKTVQRHWSKGAFHGTVNEFFELSKDNALNSLVKYTLWYCGRYLTFRSGDSVIRSQLEEFYNLFELVPLDTSLAYVPEVKQALIGAKIPMIRSYYGDIVRSCLLLVEHRAVALGRSGKALSLLSFVVNLEDIFEKYVRNLLRKALAGGLPTLTVLDGNREGRSYLFHDSKEFDIKPDLIVKAGSVVNAVADVKYKPKLSETDRYQVISAALSMGSSKAILILPGHKGVPAGLLRRGQIRDSSGIEVYEYHMPLDADFAVEEKRLCDTIRGMAA